MMIRIRWIVLAVALATACKEDKPAGYGSPSAGKKDAPKDPPAATAASGKTAATAPTATGGGGQAEEGPPPTQVRIEPRPVKIGAVITSETSSTTLLQFTGNGRTATVDTTRSELRHIEVVEADGGVIRKAKVHYESQTRAEREGFIEQESGDVLHGLQFVVWLDGAKLTATTDTGEPVPAAQATELLGDLEGELGEVPGIERVLYGRDWTYGAAVTLSAADLTALGGDMPDGTRATAGTITAVKQSKGIATFQLDLTVEVGEVGKNGFTVASVATVDVDIAAGRRLNRAASSTLDGVLDGMKGQGTLTEREELRYR